MSTSDNYISESDCVCAWGTSPSSPSFVHIPIKTSDPVSTTTKLDTDLQLYTIETKDNKKAIIFNKSHPDYKEMLSVFTQTFNDDSLYEPEPYIHIDNLYDNLSILHKHSKKALDFSPGMNLNYNGTL